MHKNFSREPNFSFGSCLQSCTGCLITDSCRFLNDTDSELLEAFVVGHLLESDGGAHPGGPTAHNDHVGLVRVALHLDPGPLGVLGVDRLDGRMRGQNGVAPGGQGGTETREA